MNNGGSGMREFMKKGILIALAFIALGLISVFNCNSWCSLGSILGGIVFAIIGVIIAIETIIFAFISTRHPQLRLKKFLGVSISLFFAVIVIIFDIIMQKGGDFRDWLEFGICLFISIFFLIKK